MKDNIIHIGVGAQKTNRTGSLLRQIESEKKKLAAFSTLASILVAVTLANNTLLAPQRQHLALEIETMAHESRGIASVESGSAGTVDQFSTEELVKRYNGSRDDYKFQAVGAKPSLLNRIRFGVLAGRYEMHLNEGKLSQIVYNESLSQNELPISFESKQAFINELRGVLPFQYSEIVKVSVTSGHETYSLRDSQNRDVGRIEFLIDGPGAILKMDVVEAKN